MDAKQDDKRDARSFPRVDAATGDMTTVEFARMELMRRFHLSLRDLRLIDPLSVCRCSILGRECAILCNLERIRCVITTDEVLLPFTPDSYVREYAAKLCQLKRGEGDELRFELALETVCSLLDVQTTETELECSPLLDELVTKPTTLNLERVRQMKSLLLSLTRRVQKVRDEIEHLMEDDGAMAEMCLTEKKRRAEASSVLDEQARPGPSHSAPVLPPSASRMHDNVLGTGDVRGSKQEVEIMLDASFLCIDNILNKLTTMKEYIDDTQEYINFNLDTVRNQLMKFDLLMNTSTFVTSIMGVVLGIFGMNFDEPLFKVPHAFEWTLTVTVVCGVLIFCFIIMWYLKKRMFFRF